MIAEWIGLRALLSIHHSGARLCFVLHESFIICAGQHTPRTVCFLVPRLG